MDGETIAKISIGKVIGDTFAILQRAWRPLGLVSLVLIGLPGLATMIGMHAFMLTPQAMFAAGPARSGFVVLTLVSIVTQLLAVGSITQGALDDANGRPSTIRSQLGSAVRSFLPILAIFILVWIASTIGFILLIVPGVIVLLRWSVAVQARIDRNLGIGAALKRSVELTRGNRWRILGFFILIMILVSVLSVVLVGLSFGAGFRPGAVQPWPVSIISVIISVVQTLVLIVAGAALYLELDRAKGGAGSAAIAETFD